MNRLLLFLCIFTWKSGLCQITVPVPVMDFTGNRLVQLVREIKNPTPDPVAFSFAHMPQTDSLLLAELFGSITNPSDTEQSKLESVNAVGAFLKSPRFQNGPLIFDINVAKADTALFRKEHSLIGTMHTMHSAQCGQWCDRARILLMKSGFFEWSDFEQVSGPGHQLLHIRLNGYFSLVDFDPGTGCFMFPFAGSPNGYASISDLQANPQLIAANYPYLYQGQPLEGIGSLQEYEQGLLGIFDVYPAGPWIDDTYKIDGDFVLPGNSSLKLKSSWIFFADTTLTETNAGLWFVEELMDSIENDSCTACIPLVLGTIAELWNVDTVTAISLFSDSSGMISYNPFTVAGQPVALPWYWRQNQPTFELKIKPRNDSIKINSGEDAKAPLFILDIEGAGSWEIGDTAGSGDANFELWSHETPLVRNYKEVNYLDTGFLLAYQGATLQLAINQNMLGFFDEWVLEGGNGLVTSAYTIIANGGAGLPVTLVTFTAEPQDKSIQLSWITASERDNYQFVVERSIDGRNFEDIQSVLGANNSEIWREYVIDDFEVLPNVTYYYRLRQEDFDGEVTFSEIRNARIVEGLVKVKIFDMNGKCLGNTEVDIQNPTLNTDWNLPSGMYFLYPAEIGSEVMKIMMIR